MYIFTYAPKTLFIEIVYAFYVEFVSCVEASLYADKSFISNIKRNEKKNSFDLKAFSVWEEIC